VSFLDALAAAGRSDDVPEADDLYGWLVGDWDLEVRRYWVDVRLRAELHAAWVLEGRAIQDVWIMPRRPERSGAPDPKADMYGTTLRVWDPAIQAWRITWHNPVANQRAEQVGRRAGADIVQLGSRADGVATRWIFSELRPDSFHWTGEALNPDGRTWSLEGEFLARRR
jgi:hypothetical protein